MAGLLLLCSEKRKRGRNASSAAALAPPARLERTTFRLGVWRFFWYDIPIITSHYF